MFSKSATTRFLESFGNVFFSLILGAIAMGFFWYYLPDQFVQLQRTAAVQEFPGVLAHEDPGPSPGRPSRTNRTGPGSDDDLGRTGHGRPRHS